MKKFQEYDARFKHLAGTALKTIAKNGGRVSREDIDSITCWPTDLYGDVKVWERTKIAWAVYECPSAPVWQMFRVSLKGLSTKEKLYCLAYHYDVNVINCHDSTTRTLTRIRVHNYLGALIRGGQLNGQLEIVR